MCLMAQISVLDPQSLRFGLRLCTSKSLQGLTTLVAAVSVVPMHGTLAGLSGP